MKNKTQKIIFHILLKRNMFPDPINPVIYIQCIKHRILFCTVLRAL